MRDPAQIDEILAALSDEWRAHPDLRLGQLISNAAGTSDVFAIADQQLLDQLRAIASKPQIAIDNATLKALIDEGRD